MSDRVSSVNARILDDGTVMLAYAHLAKTSHAERLTHVLRLAKILPCCKKRLD